MNSTLVISQQFKTRCRVGDSMAEETILESTERTSGREALRKNVQAAIALAGAVRSTLGPKDWTSY